MLWEKDRNLFIEENKGFIYNAASNVCKKRLSWENDDELSIALIAFNNACDKYNESKGNFLVFAKVAIKNALIDFFRKCSKNAYLTFSNEDNEELNKIETLISINEYEKEQENKQRAEEISMLINELSKYKLTFDDIIKSSPSHRDTRENILNIAYRCSCEKNIIDIIERKKMLPVKEILLLTGANRKFIEKWRRYLLTLIIILSSDNYPYIKSYLNIKVGEKDEE